MASSLVRAVVKRGRPRKHPIKIKPPPKFSKSTARVDTSDLLMFADRLQVASEVIESIANDWAEEHGEKWVATMRATVPVDSGTLRDSIRQVRPGGITMGDAYWWRFLEYGTSKMTPRPFIIPAMKRIRTPARKDAIQRASDLIMGRYG